MNVGEYQGVLTAASSEGPCPLCGEYTHGSGLGTDPELEGGMVAVFMHQPEHSNCIASYSPGKGWRGVRWVKNVDGEDFWQVVAPDVVLEAVRNLGWKEACA